MKERHALAKRVGILGIIGNIFLFIIKIFIGLISNSRSMIADSFNSAGDIFASIMTWIGSRISATPNDNDHNYGHGKAEYIFSMLIGVSMMIVAIKLLYDSVMSLINHNIIIYSNELVIVCTITIFVKFFLFLYSMYVYKKQPNLLVKSNMIDHRNDIVITSFTLLAITLSKYNIYWLDVIVGMGISVWILIVGIKIFMESYDVLMDHAIDSESQKKIINILKEYNQIKKVGNIYSIPIGYKYIVIITIKVNGEMKTNESHDLTDEIESKLLKEMDMIENVIVHVEPYVLRKE